MALKLYYHPLASFCWKPLIALYENAVRFEPILVDLGDETSRAAFLAVWPIGKFPVLRDEAADRTVPESTIIVEYLAHRHPGPVPLLPDDPDEALQVRLADRFLDRYVHEPMQKIVGDRLRPVGKRDPFGVEHARAEIETAYGVLEGWLANRAWAGGAAFSLADCAAAPALFYADKVSPLGGHGRLAAYLDRLKERPSFARVLAEAEPYFHMVPQEPAEG